MDARITGDALATQRTGCLVVGVFEGRKFSPSALELDAASDHALQRVLDGGDLDGELGTTLLLHAVPRLAAERVLLVGLGPEPDFSESSYRTALAAAMKALRSTGAAQATLCLHELPVKGRDGAWKIEQAVLAVADAMYRFDRLKSKPPQARRPLEKIVFQLTKGLDAASSQAAIGRAVAIAEGITLTRDLGNMPGNLCTPSYLAEQARELGQRHGFTVEILGQDAIEKLGRDDRLVGDHEHVAPALLLTRDDVRDPEVARGPLDVLDDVPAHPPGALGRVRRDDDLVDRRLELRERVLRRLHRPGLDDEALRREPGFAQRLQRLLEPPACRRAARVLVDDVPARGLVHRRDHGEAVLARVHGAQRVEQRRDAAVSFAITRT